MGIGKEIMMEGKMRKEGEQKKRRGKEQRIREEEEK